MNINEEISTGCLAIFNSVDSQTWIIADSIINMFYLRKSAAAFRA
jgi:hypothetical protein